jgi:hypothetical protein
VIGLHAPVRLTRAQARTLRAAWVFHLCGDPWKARGSRIATCERLRRLGLMRLLTFRTYRVTAAGMRWLAAEQTGGAS